MLSHAPRHLVIDKDYLSLWPPKRCGFHLDNGLLVSSPPESEAVKINASQHTTVQHRREGFLLKARVGSTPDHRDPRPSVGDHRQIMSCLQPDCHKTH